MELKAGYKQTELGVIPEDWAVVQLQEVANVVDSLHQTPSFAEDGYPMVRVSDIKTGNLNFDVALKVSESIFVEFTKNYKPKRGDIVLSRVGSYGISSFVETDEPFCMGQNTVVLQSKLPARFLYYVLNSRGTRQQIEDGSYGSGYKSLSLKNIKDLRIPVPPRDTEQHAIATTLSDVDALIGALDRLIAKKRDLKQATMQQLLTGQTRLPGFSGEWEVKPLGDVATFCAGTYLAQGNYRDGEYEVQGAGSVMGNHDVPNFPRAISVIGRVGTVGRPRFMPVGCWVNNNAAAIIAREPFGIPKFVHLLLLTVDWSKVTSVTAQPFLVVPALLGMESLVPEHDEQTVIAAVLSDMDAEIVALEARRDKTRALKQGMMQELLTGKTRLI